MKKKKMLHSCIASFLTGSMATVVHAHGMVGLSDAPISSTTRSVISNNQLANESLDQSADVEHVRPQTLESRQGVALQENVPELQVNEPLSHTALQDEPVRIIRSGYNPRRRGNASHGQPQVASSEELVTEKTTSPLYESLEVSSSNVRASSPTQNIPALPSVPAIINDEMITERQYSPPTAPQDAMSEAASGVADTSETSSRQTDVTQTDVTNGMTRPSMEANERLATEQTDTSSTFAASMQPSTPESPAVVQPQQNENERSPRAQGAIDFDFQHYEPLAGAGGSTDELVSQSEIVSSDVLSEGHGPINEGGMSIQDIVQRAIAWHPSITEALGRLYQQGEQVSVAKAGYFPQVSAGISTEHRSSTGRSEDAFSVTASQLLYDFGRISSEVDAANFGVDRDQARVWLAMDQLARDAAQAAIEVQRFEALLDIADEQIEGIDDIRLLAERRSELGASTRSDEIQAQSRLEQSEATKLQLEAQRKSWENAIRTLIGASGPVSIKHDFPQPLIESCERTSENFDNVPELLVAEAQQAEARAIIAQTQASFFPTASIDAGFNQFLNNNDLVEDDTDVTVRFNLSSNLYQGGATSARRRAADFSLQASQAARDSAYLSLSRSLREAKEQTASFRLRLATLDARARSIRETQALYRQQYLSLGTRSLLDLLNAEQEIHQSRFDQENSRYDLYSLQIDCLYSAANIRSAFDLEDSIVQGVSVLP